MKAVLRLMLFTTALLLFTQPSRAQFYAPETRFHDISQRYYVVELARVLAWRKNLHGGGIAEITYELAGEPDGSSKWNVKWLDGTGKLLYEFHVSYPASLLTEGPNFYREVFKQMTGGPLTTPSLTAQDVIQGYWKGADQMGYSRTAGLNAAFDIAPPKPLIGEAAIAPQLAGLLTHTALSSLSDICTIDPVLLARGAAWLAISESLVRDREHAGPGMDSLWSPLMFLSRRENAAGDVWKKANAPKPNAMAAGWDYLLTQPTVRDAFVFVAKPENRRFMLPMMNYYCTKASISFDFEKVVPVAFGKDRAASLLYDHYPRITRDGTVSTGHEFNTLAPLFARLDWIGCLRKYQPTPLDFGGYKGELADQKSKVQDYLSGASEEEEPCLLGLDAAAPLIQLGQKEGVGKLIPVAAATSRDLLNYGWEMTGLQIGARFHFVKESWGVPELAKRIAKAVTSKVSGLDLFFLLDDKKVSAATIEQGDRLQNVGCAHSCLVGSESWRKQAVANADELAGRFWLVETWVGLQCSLFYHANEFDRIIPHIGRVHSEGGPLCDGSFLEWFWRDLRPDGVARVPGAKDYRIKAALEQNQKDMNDLSFNVLWWDYQKKPAMERAQEYERYFWQGTSNTYAEAVYESYIEAHAYDAAKRFYRQSQPWVESVQFSATIGPDRYIQAMFEGDKDAMAEALKASDSGSYNDMRIIILDAAVRDDFKGMERQVDECLERYGKNADMSFLKGFFPLITALRDPANPDHSKALDYFAWNSNWISVQWILARNAKLSVDESVRFFGGTETDLSRQFEVLALLKDADNFKKKYDKLDLRFQTLNAKMLVYLLRNELLGIPAPAQQPDLKPANAMTLSELVLNTLKKTPAPSK